MNNFQIQSMKYGGFTSYGNGQVSTLKPGIDNQYYKNIYNDISKYSSREIPYYDDKTRYSSNYNESQIKFIKQDNYHVQTQKTEAKKDLDNYQYKHESNAIEIISEGKKKNEESIRSK